MVEIHLPESETAPADRALLPELDLGDRAFASLPMRARGRLELIDVAIKIYGQYWKVLLSWSALVVLLGFDRTHYVPAGTGKGYFGVSGWSVFLLPFIAGSVSVCLTAAMRGQAVRFQQCWRPSLAIYWKFLATTILGLLLVILSGSVALVALAVFIVVSKSSITPGQPWIAGGLIFLFLTSIGSIFIALWSGIATVTIAMERKVGARGAMGRAFALLRGTWLKSAGLNWITWLSGLLFFLILLFGWALIVRLLVSLTSLRTLPKTTPHYNDKEAVLLTVILNIAAIVWLPFYQIVLSLLYFDLRIRKEGYDIEWNAAMSDLEDIGTPASTPAMV